MKRSIRLLLSAASGALAIAMAFQYGSSVRAEADRERQEVLASYGGELVSVCVASHDIEAGEVLDESCFSMEEWVGSLLPEDAFTDADDVMGETATSSIPARAVLCPVYLEEREGAIEVPAGMVAVSVPADEQSAVGGAIAPGDRVDVYVSDKGIADRLCSARVIDTSSSGDEAAGAMAWVTLAVEPDRVSEVLAATASGSISLTLPDSSIEEEGTDEPDGAAPPADGEAGGRTRGGG